MQLYELADEIRKAHAALEDLDTPDAVARHFQEQKLETLFPMAKDRLAAMGRWGKNLGAEFKALDAERKLLTVRAKAAEEKAQGLRGYLFACLKLLGLRKFKDAAVNMWIQNNPVFTVQHPEGNAIPEKWRKAPVIECDTQQVLADFMVQVEFLTDQAAKEAGVTDPDTLEVLRAKAWDQAHAEFLPQGFAIVRGEHLRLQ